MNRMLIFVVWICVLGMQGSAYSDSVHSDLRFSFFLGEVRKGPEVIIAELRDRKATGVGKSLSYLVWREMIMALGDQTGSDIIFLTAEKEEKLKQLRPGRHKVALEIAEKYGAAMILWGEVRPQTRDESGRVRVKTYLTVNPEAYDGKFALQLEIDSEKNTFQAELQNTRFKLAPVTMQYKELFTRQLRTRVPATVRSRPSSDAKVISQLPVGAILQAQDIQNTWFQVPHSKGGVGFVEGRQVFLMPGLVKMPPSIPVRFSLPVQHFVVGLSYYRSRRFEDAYWEFSQFIEFSSKPESRHNIASAYQWQGASLLFETPFIFDETRHLNAFSKAIKINPNDPHTYYLRALARFGGTGQLDGVLEEVAAMLEIDISNQTARKFLRQLGTITKIPRLDLPDLGWLKAVMGIEQILAEDNYVKLMNIDPLEDSRDTVERAIIKVINHTNYLLRLYYVGSDSAIIEVPSNNDRDIFLAGGEYEVAAEFVQSLRDKELKIRPMYGQQEYKPNKSYKFDFYLKWRSGG